MRPTAVENISDSVKLGHPELDEPAFITGILDRAHCGLLHPRCSLTAESWVFASVGIRTGCVRNVPVCEFTLSKATLGNYFRKVPMPHSRTLVLIGALSAFALAACGGEKFSSGGRGIEASLGGSTSSAEVGGTATTGSEVRTTSAGASSTGLSPDGGNAITGGDASTGGVGSVGVTLTGGTGPRDSSNASGGSSGGTEATGGRNTGVSTSGGTRETGGASTSGGTRPTGGANAAGGTGPIGGASASGGSRPTGGASATGGTRSTGGANATGGTNAAGASVSGGSSGTSGATSLGGGSSITLTFGERAGTSCSGVTVDTELNASTPDLNYGGSGLFGCDANPLTVGLLGFWVELCPAAVANPTKVVAARLHLHTGSCAGCQASANTTIQLYELVEKWDEGYGSDTGTESTANWNNRTDGVAWSGAGATGKSRGTSLLAEFKPTQLDTEYVIALPASSVQNWFDQPLSNWGIVLSPVSTSASPTDRVSFVASDSHDNLSPLLEVDFAAE